MDFSRSSQPVVDASAWVKSSGRRSSSSSLSESEVNPVLNTAVYPTIREHCLPVMVLLYKGAVLLAGVELVLSDLERYVKTERSGLFTYLATSSAFLRPE